MVNAVFVFLFKVCFAASFAISSLVNLTVAFVFYASIRPFSKRLYRNIIWYLLLVPYAHLAFLTDWWSLLKLNIYMDGDDFRKYFAKEHALLIINHSYEIDWLPLISICGRTQMLSNIRMFVKKSLKYIPIFGWSFIASEFVLLHRSYEKDEKIIRNSVREFGNYPYHIWLVLYPEGTWFNQHNYRASLEFEEKMKLPKLKHHLQPRTNGFVTAVREMRGHIKAIYNIEIAFEEGAVKPCSRNILEGKQMSAHIYIKRIAEEDLPTDNQQLAVFLRDMFQIKDNLLGSFKETGSFFTRSNIPVENCIKIERPFYVVPIFIVSCSTVVPLLLYSTMQLYLSYGLTSVFVITATFSVSFFAVNFAAKFTEMSRT